MILRLEILIEEINRNRPEEKQNNQCKNEVLTVPFVRYVLVHIGKVIIIDIVFLIIL